MSSSDVTRDGVRGVAPDREARIGTGGGGSGGGGGSRGGGRRGGGRPGGERESVVGRPEFQSYYGLPVLNKPTWAPLDIAGYLFLGGMAGASSALAAASWATGQRGLARPLRIGAAGAISLSLVALVHDLGRPSRFYNMLRVFKPSSPMSVGSWILSVYGQAAIGAAGLSFVPSSVRRRRPAVDLLEAALTIGAGVVGPAVATYTGVLVADTAVPAWHGGYREMPFLFAGSAASAAGGLGVLAAPVPAAGPAARLGVAGAMVELAVGRLMRRRMGMVASAYDTGRAGRLMRAAEGLTAVGAVLVGAGRVGAGRVGAGRRSRVGGGRVESRVVSAVGGVCLIAGSACTRFGVFHAGVQSAEDPRFTVQPQRERVDRAAPHGH